MVGAPAIDVGLAGGNGAYGSQHLVDRRETGADHVAGGGTGPGRALLVLACVAAGLALAVVWSFRFVDRTIGDNVANGLLGYDAKARPITGTSMGTLFAFVSGLAGTFTACNVAGFSALAPLTSTRRASFLQSLRGLGWLTLAACGVAGTYGAVGALAGEHIPQLSTRKVGDFPVRLIQSCVGFSLIGVVLITLGLIALRLVRNPLAGVYARHPRAQLVVMGALIGGFLVARPFPLFQKMFQYAASTHNPLFGSLAFMLQTVGNVAVMAVLFVLLTAGTRGRFQRWLAARPGRADRFTAGALLVAGTFTLSYWGLRVPSLFGVGWWPSVPWT
jgi:hypothetical protein